jgi:hypothetical protein
MVDFLLRYMKMIFFEDNIGKSFKDNLDYRVVSSKKVFLYENQIIG